MCGQKSREQNIVKWSVQHLLWKPALNLPKVSHLKDWMQTNAKQTKTYEEFILQVEVIASYPQTA